MSKDNTTLKSCPFCGGEADFEDYIITEEPNVYCSAYTQHKGIRVVCVVGCCSTIGEYKNDNCEVNKNNQSKQWNTRPLEDALKAKADMFDELVDIQSKYYGDGIGLHMEMYAYMREYKKQEKEFTE